MRICHLIYDDLKNPWLAGGGAVRAWEIYRRLADRHEITVITGSFPGAQAEECRAGVRFLRVGSGRGYALSRLGYCGQAVACLKRLEWDLWVHEFSAFAPLWASRSLRQQGILFFYHFVGRHALKKHPLVGGLAWIAEALTLRGYRRIVAISPSVQAQIRRRLRGRPVQVDCVYTGVDARYFALEPLEEPYLLYLGRLDLHTKGLDLLIQAFARVAPAWPGVGLKIAGRGTFRQQERVRRLARRAGIGDRIALIGGVDEQEKGELLRRALFVCMPSRYEGWGIVAIEAAAAGKAVLGTRIDGLQDAVQDGQTGLLVPADQVEALAQGMERLLGQADWRRQLGTQGRVWARRFDWDRLARDQEEIFLQVAAGQKA